MKVRTLTAIIALLIFLPILLKGGTILMLLLICGAHCFKRIVKYEYD